jgi:hypothetical protein
VSKSIVTGQLGGIRMCIIVHLVLSLSLVAVHFGCSNHQLCENSLDLSAMKDAVNCDI